MYIFTAGCVKRESNPQLNLGRVTCYHYTINALVPSYLDRTGDILITARKKTTTVKSSTTELNSDIIIRVSFFILFYCYNNMYGDQLNGGFLDPFDRKMANKIEAQ